jgi:hypothetical protein
MPASRHPSPLAAAVLAVVHGEVGVPAVVDRLAAAGARVEVPIAERCLDELATLGLVRVTRGSGERRRFVLTSLGRSVVRASLNGEPAGHLADLERLRTDLLSTIAHELRTPLTAVRTSVGLLLAPDAEPTEEQRTSLLETIERNADRMQRLVTDILDLARFRAGRIRLQLRRVDPVDLARGAAGALAVLAREHGATIAIDVAAEPVAVYADRRRLEQALVNLVSNAIRYGLPAGPVTVEVRGDAERTRWAVRDLGPGISHDDRAHLFERFFVGRTDRHGAREGVGLGLPTALAIAQAHGGTIEVETGPGQGSTFTLVVPTEGPEEPE